MLVKIEHYKSFCEDNLQQWNQKLKNKEAEYAKQKIIYESNKIRKFLGWKFENSSGGNRGFWGSWYFGECERSIIDWEIELNKVHYEEAYSKFIWLKERFSTSFYTYCIENGLP